MAQEWFGELRSLIQPPGTEGKWLEICTLLAQPDVEIERVQWWDYVAEHLDRHWRAAALLVPEAWLDRLWRGLPLPAVAGLCATLDVSHRSVTDRQARLIAMCAQLANLTALDLSMNELGPDGARVIASSPHLRQVQTLSIARNRLELPALKMLLGMWRLSGVRTLDLSGNLFGDDGARLLAGSPVLAQLEALDLSSCRIGDDGALALARAARGQARLRKLALGWNTFGEGALRVLETLPCEVDLRGNATDAPMVATPDAQSVARRQGEADSLRSMLQGHFGGEPGEEDYDEVME